MRWGTANNLLLSYIIITVLTFVLTGGWRGGRGAGGCRGDGGNEQGIAGEVEEGQLGHAADDAQHLPISMHQVIRPCFRSRHTDKNW